jgi:hypothetical protein
MESCRKPDRLQAAVCRVRRRTVRVKDSLCQLILPYMARGRCLKMIRVSRGKQADRPQDQETSMSFSSRGCSNRHSILNLKALMAKVLRYGRPFRLNSRQSSKTSHHLCRNSPLSLKVLGASCRETHSSNRRIRKMLLFAPTIMRAQLIPIAMAHITQL